MADRKFAPADRDLNGPDRDFAQADRDLAHAKRNLFLGFDDCTTAENAFTTAGYGFAGPGTGFAAPGRGFAGAKSGFVDGDGGLPLIWLLNGSICLRKCTLSIPVSFPEFLDPCLQNLDIAFKLFYFRSHFRRRPGHVVANHESRRLGHCCIDSVYVCVTNVGE